MNTEDIADFRPALLKFMATATPNEQLARDIVKDFDSHMDAIRVTPISHFSAGDHVQVAAFEADDVPDAVSPVKAKLAYIQVPNKAGDNTELHLVWKVCGCMHFWMYLLKFNFLVRG